MTRTRILALASVFAVGALVLLRTGEVLGAGGCSGPVAECACRAALTSSNPQRMLTSYLSIFPHANTICNAMGGSHIVPAASTTKQDLSDNANGDKPVKRILTSSGSSGESSSGSSGASSSGSSGTSGNTSSSGSSGQSSSGSSGASSSGSSGESTSSSGSSGTSGNTSSSGSSSGQSSGSSGASSSGSSGTSGNTSSSGSSGQF